MNKKDQDNQSSPEPSLYILLELEYNSQFLFPLEEGMEIVKTLAHARKVTDRYDKPLKIVDKPISFKITIYSSEQLNIMEVQNGLLPEDTT